MDLNVDVNLGATRGGAVTLVGVRGQAAMNKGSLLGVFERIGVLGWVKAKPLRGSAAPKP